MNNNAQEILTAGVTDFATSLQKRNTERLTQISENIADWSKYGVAEVNRAKSQNAVKVFEGFAGLSTSAQKLAKAGKTAVDSQKSKEITALFNNIKSGEVKSVQGAIGLAFEEGRLKRDLSEFKNEINRLVSTGDLSPETGDYLINNHGGSILNTRNALGHYTVANGDELFKNHLNSDGNLQLQWDGATGAEKAHMYTEFLNSELSKTFDKKYIANHYSAAIIKRASTKEIVEQLKYQGTALTKESVKIDNIFENSFRNVKNGGNVNEPAEILSGLIVANSGTKPVPAVKNDLTLRLTRLGLTRNLSSSDLKAIRTGLIKHEAGTIKVTEDNKEEYPGFEVGDRLGTGELLLSTDQWNQIQSGIDQGNKAFNDGLVVQRNTNLSNSVTEFLETGDQSVKQNALADYISAGGLDTDEAYKSFENLNFSHQSPEVYEFEKNRTNNIIRQGTVASYDEAIASTQNVKLQQELTIAKKNFQSSQKLNNLTKENISTIVTTSIQKSSEKTINQQGKLKYDSIPVSDYLTNKLNRIVAEVYAENGSNPSINIKKEVQERFDAEVTAEGLFEQPNSPNRGPLTPSNTGAFPGFKIFSDALEEQSRGDHITKSANTIIKAFKANPNASITDIINIDGAILKDDEIVAFKFNNWNPETKTINGWPPDVLLKAEILGISPSTLVNFQLNALINNPEKADIVDRYQLKDMLNNIPQPDEELLNFLKENDAKDLVSKFRFQGAGSLTQKDIQEILKIEEVLKGGLTQENILGQAEDTGRPVEDIKAINSGEGLETVFYESEEAETAATEAKELEIKKEETAKLNKLYKDNGADKAVEQFTKALKNYYSTKAGFPEGEFERRFPNGITYNNIKWDAKTKTWLWRE